MAYTIKPFRATYYNPLIYKDLSSLVCPPYDVISKEQCEILRKKSPYNFCHILLTVNSNYKEIGERFRKWLEEKKLIDDKKETLYLYEQKFIFEGTLYKRFGILSLLRIDEKDVIFPHEYTLKEPKEDRRRVIEEMEANLSPIFVIIPNPPALFAKLYKMYYKKIPFLKFKDFEGHDNRIWKIEDERTIKKICREIDKYKLVIADGHHRFEVAADYYRTNKGRFKNLNYILSYLTYSQNGLLVLPTHRVVSLKDKEGLFFEKLKEYFFIRKIDESSLRRKLKSKGIFCFGIYKDKSFYFLRLKNKAILDRIFHKSIYKEIDTYVLHQFVFPMFMIEDKINYTHSIEEVKKMVSDDKIAFLLRPLSLDTISKIANKGYRLPQKSTYFYPKVPSGMLIRRFRA